MTAMGTWKYILCGLLAALCGRLAALCGNTVHINLFIIQVNSKGYVSFERDMVLEFDGELSQVDSEVIAPFLADIDTGSTGAVYYRYVINSGTPGLHCLSAVGYPTMKQNSGLWDELSEDTSWIQEDFYPLV
jgi:hypothetical protein